MDDRPTLMDELRVLRQAVPGALVFVAVLLLLRGYDGTVYLLGRQASMLAESFLGGPDVLFPVLVHTLPLALAAGVASFAISAGWVRFESFWSVIVLSGIIIAGTTVGGLLRTFLPAPTPAAVDHGTATVPVESVQPLSAASGVPLNAVPGIQGISVLQTGKVSQPPLLVPPSPLQSGVRPSAWQQLSEIDFLAIPDLAKPPPTDIAPIQVVPKVSGILNVVGLAVNQLLGFLVAYQPRLFLAAVLAGGWTGWRWQQRLRTLKQHLDSDDDSHRQHDTPAWRQAA